MGKTGELFKKIRATKGAFHAKMGWIKDRNGMDLTEAEGFPCSSLSKESACSAEDLGSVPGSGRSPGEGNSNPLQYHCLGNLMDR